MWLTRTQNSRPFGMTAEQRNYLLGIRRNRHKRVEFGEERAMFGDDHDYVPELLLFSPRSRLVARRGAFSYTLERGKGRGPKCMRMLIS